MRHTFTILILACCTMTPACCGTFHVEERPTKGAELTDLYAAYREGAITRQEYDDAKQRILERE